MAVATTVEVERDGTLAGEINLTFDEAASATAWEPIADATLPEAVLTWNENGVETGALEFGGSNTSDGIGRAYIVQYLDANVDYEGASSVTLTFDAKLAAPPNGAALHMQTEFPGLGTTNNFDIQGQGLNEASWTGYSFTFDNIWRNGIFRLQFNVCLGRFVGAGGVVLLDNVALSGSGDNGGGGGGTDTTTFQVDMNCATAPGAMTNGTTEVTEVFVTGPWCGWCSADGYNVLTDADGDGIFTVDIADLTGDVEYKYGVNGFADQEQLVDDAVNGGTCAPITDSPDMPTVRPRRDRPPTMCLVLAMRATPMVVVTMAAAVAAPIRTTSNLTLMPSRMTVHAPR